MEPSEQYKSTMADKDGAKLRKKVELWMLCEPERPKFNGFYCFLRS
jgi:hypothetical protein